MHSHGVDTHSTDAADNQFFFFGKHNKNIDHAPAHKQDKPAESWFENQRTITAACDKAEQLPQLQRVVMYTPPLFFSNCLLVHILSREQQSYTAASLPQH